MSIDLLKFVFCFELLKQLFLQIGFYFFIFALKRDRCQAPVCLDICSEVSYRWISLPARSFQWLHGHRSFPQPAGTRKRNIPEELLASKRPALPPPLHQTNSFCSMPGSTSNWGYFEPRERNTFQTPGASTENKQLPAPFLFEREGSRPNSAHWPQL